MISNREKQWHYPAVKTLPALLGQITKHRGDFYCLNCFHSFAGKNKLQSHKRVCENKDFCNMIIPSEDTKIIELNQYQKSDNAPFIIYVDLECITEEIDECKNNPENSSTSKVSEHIPFFECLQYLLLEAQKISMICQRNKDCMTKFYKFLREHAMEIIHFKKKKMSLLTKEQQ